MRDSKLGWTVALSLAVAASAACRGDQQESSATPIPASERPEKDRAEGGGESPAASPAKPPARPTVDALVTFAGERQPVSSVDCNRLPGILQFAAAYDGDDDNHSYRLTVVYDRTEDDEVDFSAPPKIAQLQIYFDRGTEFYMNLHFFDAKKVLVDAGDWELEASKSGLRGTLKLGAPPDTRTKQETYPDGLDIELDLSC
jgi:hypothetical protein